MAEKVEGLLTLIRSEREERAGEQAIHKKAMNEVVTLFFCVAEVLSGFIFAFFFFFSFSLFLLNRFIVTSFQASAKIAELEHRVRQATE